MTPAHRRRRSSFRASTAFVNRPGPLSDEQEAEEYLHAAGEKLAIARRHLEALREAEGRLTGEGFAEALLGEEENISLIEGHGDALLLELSGAFDAFACAVAFRLGRSNPHVASFSEQLSQRWRPLGPLVERIKRGFRWKHLTYYRNLAAHKVVVASPAWADESGIHRLRLPDRLPPNPQSARGSPPHPPLEPAMPIFEALVDWAEKRFNELDFGVPRNLRLSNPGVRMRGFVGASVYPGFVARRRGPCIYCRGTTGPFRSREHPLPEGLGNTEIVLPRGVVCDPCNNGPLSRVDQTFLNFGPIASMRVFQGVPTKAGAYPRANFSNVSLAQIGPSEIQIISKSRKATREQPGGFKLEMISPQRLTPRYLADLTRFLHKAALGLMYIDHGREFVLDSRFDEVRDIVRGAAYNGYLFVPKKVDDPGPEVSFSYDFATIDGQETVIAWIIVSGLWMATDLLIRNPNDLDPRFEAHMTLLRF